MPKISHDFSKEIIFYIIKCNDVERTEIYIGSTFNFTQRKNQHKQVCNNSNSPNYNLKIYLYIRENGGWDNFTMTMLDRKVCTDMLEARKHEQILITQYKSELNMRKAFGGESKKEYFKQYQMEHADKYKEQHKQYYIENIDKITQYKKEYQLINSDEIKDKNAQYYLDNKIIWDKNSELRKEKVECECGCIISKARLTTHRNSPKHFKIMELKNVS